MNPKKASYENLAETIIKNLEKRGMKGFYCEDSSQLVETVLKELGESKSITWGGSMTLKECGLMEALEKTDHILLDRMEAKTPEEKKAFYGKAVMADVFLTSTNAITLDGELVNMDGNGNRVACIITGPDEVFVIAGMNKVVRTVEDGINRIKMNAAPPNGVRLNTNTPCAYTGICADCYAKDCMCCELVITRKSRIPGRIKVFLTGEELGY